MMRTATLLLALSAAPVLGCAGAESTTDSVSRDALDIRTWIEGEPSRGVATLAVQVSYDEDVTVEVDEPSVTGLRFTEVGEGKRERLGSRLVLTRRYRFSGEEGSYEIPALEATGSTDDASLSATSDPIWIDVGVEAPPLEGFEDISDPDPVFRLSRAAIVGVVCVGITGVGLLGSLGLGLWAFSGRKPRTLPPEAPDVVALRRWNVVRHDPDLDDMEKAVALAVLFREYVEVVLAFPATAWTTSEILEHLGRMTHLPEGNVGRAKRILRATDRIKFADAAARETLFEELDDALRTFISSTRPRQWDGDA